MFTVATKIFFFICTLLLGMFFANSAAKHRPVQKNELQAKTSELVTIGLSGSRGLISEWLWFKISKLQSEDRFAEIVPLTDALLRLDATSTGSWIYNAWNLSFNICSMYNRKEDRWNWVWRGIGMLENDALVFNPNAADILLELGWLYEAKINGSLDEFSYFYREKVTEKPWLRDVGFVEQALGKLDWRLPLSRAAYWYYRCDDLNSKFRICTKLLHDGTLVSINPWQTSPRWTIVPEYIRLVKIIDREYSDNKRTRQLILQAEKLVKAAPEPYNRELRKLVKELKNVSNNK